MKKSALIIVFVIITIFGIKAFAGSGRTITISSLKSYNEHIVTELLSVIIGENAALNQKEYMKTDETADR